MKKLLPIGLGVVALGLLAAPKFIGNQFEQKFNKITQSINDQPGYQIEVLEYDQAWFGTSAKLALVIGLDALTQGQMPGEELRIPLELNANHGPILLSDNASFGLVQWQLSAAAEALREHLTWPSDQAFYQMDASLGFGSQLDYQDRFVAFNGNKLIEGVESQFSFSGYEGKAELKDGVFDYKGQAKQLDYKDAVDKAAIEGMSIESKLDASLDTFFDQMFFAGEGEFKIASITFQEGNESALSSINDIYMKTQTSINQDNQSVNVSVTYGVESVSLEDFKGEDLALGVEFNNISQDFLTAYQAFAASLMQATGEQSFALMMGFLQDNLLNLVQAEPEINITSLRATLPQGEIDSYLNTRLTGISDLPANLNDLPFWLSHLNAEAMIKGDKSVVEDLAKTFMLHNLKSNPQTLGMSDAQLAQIVDAQLPMFMQGISMQGFVVGDETSYSSQLLFKDKVLTVNDKPVPLAF